MVIVVITTPMVIVALVALKEIVAIAALMVIEAIAALMAMMAKVVLAERQPSFSSFLFSFSSPSFLFSHFHVLLQELIQFLFYSEAYMVL